MTGIYDTNDTLITRGVQEALPSPQTTEILNTTLDGKPHLQVIGTGYNTLNITAHFTHSQMRALYSRKNIGTPLKVIFDGRQYTGPISGPIEPTRTPSAGGARFTLMFTILVQSEGAV